jgi:uncharacterized delta-60 repeat protein
MQGDKIIVVGSTTMLNSSTNDFTLARYRQDGFLDSSFGEDGLVSTDFDGDADIAQSVVIQGDKIIVAGSAYNKTSFNDDFALARYNADGSIDSTFGQYGRVMTDYTNEWASSVALLGEKIVVAGSQIDSNTLMNFAIALYEENGKLDSSFGENGFVRSFAGAAGSVQTVAIQNDKILLGGSVFNENIYTYEFTLARYNSNGQFDSSFDYDGVVIPRLGSIGISPSIAIQGDKIIVAGYSFDSLTSDTDFALSRYNSNGSVDYSFGRNGLAETDIDPNGEGPQSIVVYDGKIVAVGTAFYSGDFAIVRYTLHGSLDSSFNKKGYAIGSYPSARTYFTSGVMQNDKIVAAGYAYNSAIRNNDFAIARYNSDGSPDATFNFDGIVTTDFGGNDLAQSIALQGDKVIVTGSGNNPNTFFNDFVLSRYNPDGGLDSSFGTNGLVSTGFGFGDEFAESMLIQENKILVTGSAYNANTGDYDFALARFTANGSPDSSFGDYGLVTEDLGSSEGAVSIATQGNDIIIVGFSFNPNTFLTYFTLLRYNSFGVLDSSFGKNGVVVVDLGLSGRPRSILVDDSTILVAGYLGNLMAFNNDLAIMRFTYDGNLDSSFGKHGVVTTDLGSDEEARSIILQEDKFIVGGNLDPGTDKGRFVIIRYNKNGSIDSTYGKHGVQLTGTLQDSYSLEQILLNEKNLYAIGSIDLSGVSNVGAVAAYKLEEVSRIICPRDTTVATNEGSCTAVVSDIDPVSIEGTYSAFNYTLAGATSGSGTGTASDISFNKGITIVTYKLATDTTVNCFFRVTVKPSEELCNGVDDNCDGTVDEGCPQLTVSIEDATVLESQWLARVTVRLSGPRTNQWVLINYTIKDKSAIHSKDYYGITYPLLFIPGFNRTARIFIPIIPDNEVEGIEQFEIHLRDPLNATIKDGIGLVSIIDDDVFTTVNKTIDSTLKISVSPNPSWIVFTIKINGGDTKHPIILRTYDLAGRIIEVRSDVRPGQSVQLGHRYRPGSYIIEATQGNQHVRTKVIKLGN